MSDVQFDPTNYDDYVRVPRARYEALQARAERLRLMVRGFSAAIEYLALGEPRPPDVEEMYAQACDLYAAHYPDLADDLKGDTDGLSDDVATALGAE